MRKPRIEPRQRALGFDAGQLHAQAEVDARTEHQVRIGEPVERQHLGLIELGWVGVGRGVGRRLWLGNGRRPIVMQGLTLAEADVEAGLSLMLNRVRAEEAIIGRILGLKPGSVDLMGSVDDLRSMIVAWNQAGPSGL
jgi:hypothetical protein